jgi:hypothetical protein
MKSLNWASRRRRFLQSPAKAVMPYGMQMMSEARWFLCLEAHATLHQRRSGTNHLNIGQPNLTDDSLCRAIEAGAVALVVVNHDQTRPDHSFSMSLSGDEDDEFDSHTEEDQWKPNIPIVMVSWNSGQAILEDHPERLRLYPGGGRPFIESGLPSNRYQILLLY